MSPPEVAVGVVLFDAQGRVLLIQRGQPPSEGRWTLPGGRVERGETLQQAALRELAAETGVTATLGPLVEVFEYIDERFHYIILDYLATAPAGTPRAGEDARDARFVALCDLPGLALTPGLLPVLERARALLQA